MCTMLHAANTPDRGVSRVGQTTPKLPKRGLEVIPSVRGNHPGRCAITSELSLFKRPQVGDERSDVLRRQPPGEGGHLPLLAVADPHRDLFVGPVQIVQIGPFVSSPVRAMAMRAVLQEQLLPGARDYQ